MNTEYVTRDLQLACVLKMAGIPLIRVESYSDKGLFVFKNSLKVEETTASYFNDLITMNPRAVFETWKGLKSQAHTASNTVR